MKSDLKSEIRDDCRIISLSGVINAENSAIVQEQVSNAAAGWGESQVVLNLGGVGYVSSAALRVFMELWKLAKANACELVLAAPTEDVREVLELTGFQNIFRIAGTVDEVCT